MVISERSQLGLRFAQEDTKRTCLGLLRDFHEEKLERLTNDLWETQEQIKAIKQGKEVSEEELSNLIVWKGSCEEATEDLKTLSQHIDYNHLFDCKDSSYYMICDTVYQAAELIRISSNFTGRTLKDIPHGKYTYLMGKYKMLRFICMEEFIHGIYYNEQKKSVFTWVIDPESGEYIFPKEFQKEFSMLMQVLTFVELGDITVTMLESLKKSSGRAKSEKDYNSSSKNVFIVDSSWNQITIRTDGFAVRGHFKLQPCGKNLENRKLIWVNSFEKHGYTRRAKAEIRK